LFKNKDNAIEKGITTGRKWPEFIQKGASHFQQAESIKAPEN